MSCESDGTWSEDEVARYLWAIVDGAPLHGTHALRDIADWAAAVHQINAYTKWRLASSLRQSRIIPSEMFRAMKRVAPDDRTFLAMFCHLSRIHDALAREAA